MISLVLYGRNDNYGYNLHKRAALSLNCMAEVLSDPDDEILFVDYNTPDDFPTFPEAIQDTLTDKARQRLRILRARPYVHARYSDRTHLVALEPVARNIAVRRSNPVNRWILSTNTDMIFVPRTGKSLSDVVAPLRRGYYGIPRFELPESMWETLNRFDAPGVISMVAEWGSRFHLNETILGATENKFDAPGDFQLVEREVLMSIRGFEEDMLLGWHVDSNLCKRLYLLYREVGDLTANLHGYHCDHTRQVTPAHHRRATENSIRKYVTEIDDSISSTNPEDWGCAAEDIEEIRILENSGAVYLRALESSICRPADGISEWTYDPTTYDQVSYSPSHVLPYLMDVLVSAPRSWSVAWFGGHPAMFELFCAAWRDLGFSGEILVSPELPGDPGRKGASMVSLVSLEEACKRADAFIFDFVADDGAPLGRKGAGHDALLIEWILRAFYSALAEERRRTGHFNKTRRRIIAINAIHNRFETLMLGHIDFARSPANTRLRHGFVSESSIRPGREEWLPLMHARPNAKRTANGVRVDEGSRGYVMSGPGISLLPGEYRLDLGVRSDWLSVWQWLKILKTHLFGRTREREKSVISSPTALPSKKGPEKRRWRKRAALTVELQSRGKVICRLRVSPFRLARIKAIGLNFRIRTEDVIVTQPLAINVAVWSSGMLGLEFDRLDILSTGEQS